MGDSIQVISTSHFEKIRKLGVGSLGKVYLAKQKTTNIDYAIKFIKIESDDNSSIASYLENLNRIKHPRILPIFGLSYPDPSKKRPFSIVTNFQKNGSLLNIIKNPEVFTNLVKMKIIFGVAEAMRYLHEFHIIHEHLFPTNILIDDDFNPLLTDCAQNFFSPNTIKIPQGSKCFVAPELHSKNSPTPASDVFSFGMILYTIITEKLPFEENKKQHFSAIESGERPNFPESVPGNFQILISQCWDQNPAKRPSFELIVLRLLKNDFFLPLNENETTIFQNYRNQTLSPTFSINTIISSTNKIDELMIQNENLHKIVESLRQQLTSLSATVSYLSANASSPNTNHRKIPFPNSPNSIKSSPFTESTPPNPGNSTENEIPKKPDLSSPFLKNNIDNQNNLKHVTINNMNFNNPKVNPNDINNTNETNSNDQEHLKTIPNQEYPEKTMNPNNDNNNNNNNINYPDEKENNKNIMENHNGNENNMNNNEIYNNNNEVYNENENQIENYPAINQPNQNNDNYYYGNPNYDQNSQNYNPNDQNYLLDANDDKRDRPIRLPIPTNKSYISKAGTRRLSSKLPIKPLLVAQPSNQDYKVQPKLNFTDPQMRMRRNSMQPPIPQNTLKREEDDGNSSNDTDSQLLPSLDPNQSQSPLMHSVPHNEYIKPAPPQQFPDQISSHKSTIDFQPILEQQSGGIQCPYEKNPFEGIIYYLSNQCHGNVVDNGLLIITGKSADKMRDQDLKMLVDYSWNRCWTSENKANSWIQFDFCQKLINLRYYTLKTYPSGKGYSHLKSWVIQGSSNGQKWTDIDRRIDNEDLNGKSKIQVFQCSNPIDAKLIRIVQIGPNHFGDDYLILTNIEFFGSIL